MADLQRLDTEILATPSGEVAPQHEAWGVGRHGVGGDATGKAGQGPFLARLPEDEVGPSQHSAFSQRAWRGRRTDRATERGLRSFTPFGHAAAGAFRRETQGSAGSPRSERRISCPLKPTTAPLPPWPW
jgi:hypothetical protein